MGGNELNTSPVKAEKALKIVWLYMLSQQQLYLLHQCKIVVAWQTNLRQRSFNVYKILWSKHIASR